MFVENTILTLFLDCKSQQKIIALVTRPDADQLWTGMFMNIELQDVILDLMTSPTCCMARVNLIKSRLIYESFSDSSRDIDLVSQEILLSDLRFNDYPMNKRSNVFTQILKPMKIAERTSLLQAEVHFRATSETNRFTILLNNMRLMGIFDWWTAVLEFLLQVWPMKRFFQFALCKKMIDLLGK